MKWFLWGHGNVSKGRAKVAWKEACIPKLEGGLGIRRISDVNKSLMAYHIYSLLAGRESLWTNWVRNYRLRGRSLWDVPIQANSPWGWKRLMKCRHIFREFLWCKIGNGQTAFLWFDKWSAECPLANIVTPRQMARYGYSIKSKVVDAIHNGEWAWPEEWRTEETLDTRPYSRSVWHSVRNKVDMNSVQESWDEITSWLVQRAKSKAIYAVGSRLLVAAAAYTIWNERNSRFFSNKLRPPEKIVDIIINMVRTKLISFKYKQTSNVKRFLEEWKLNKEDLLED
ncbi:uncharacterized protein LOC110888175 [Helianthus annuus]|uniref:uncharacterized protein LOC110888175 n=1 Tax=Helianthus annuus TaxID=4232 RepID=UPI000B9074E2|nr:uncharacterized protein LOC110888175 [Helianthus annuus]